MLRLAESVEKPLHCVSLESKLDILTASAKAISEALSD